MSYVQNAKPLAFIIFFLLFAFFPGTSFAKEELIVELTSGIEIDLRVFSANGDSLLLGFACDEGRSLNEEHTAEVLAGQELEVWMPDLLGAYMLPKVRSSLAEIPETELVELIEYAHKQSGKKIYLIATGPDTELVLRGAAAWEKAHDANDESLAGAILMFPRLNDGEPEPGMEPKYIDAVGSTKLPLMVLEGQRTPNSWGLEHFAHALGQGGSHVLSRIIPGVRGYFFKRGDASEPEELVTSQMSGLIKASLLFLDSARETQ